MKSKAYLRISCYCQLLNMSIFNKYHTSIKMIMTGIIVYICIFLNCKYCRTLCIQVVLSVSVLRGLYNIICTLFKLSLCTFSRILNFSYSSVNVNFNFLMCMGSDSHKHYKYCCNKYFFIKHLIILYILI